ncbi:MAG: hypothetical protein ABSF77_06485 [Spirochaetia bacterium]
MKYCDVDKGCICGPRLTAAHDKNAARVYDEPNLAPQGAAGPAKSGPKYWMQRLAELLAAMMADPQIAALIDGKANGPAAAPAAAPGAGKVPAEVPGGRNPTGASPAAGLRPGAAADSLDAIVNEIRGAARPAPRTLDGEIAAIRGGR